MQSRSWYRVHLYFQPCVHKQPTFKRNLYIAICTSLSHAIYCLERFLLLRWPPLHLLKFTLKLIEIHSILLCFHIANSTKIFGWLTHHSTIPRIQAWVWIQNFIVIMVSDADLAFNINEEWREERKEDIFPKCIAMEYMIFWSYLVYNLVHF